MRQITPMGNRVLLEQLQPPTQTPSGILIPLTVQLREFQVIALGPEADHFLWVGAVCWVTAGGNEITVDNRTFLLIKDSEIGAIIEAVGEAE